MFGKSIQSLQEDLRELESQAASQAGELVDSGVNSDQLVEALMPINLRVVALRNTIRHKTPWKELVARRKYIEGQLHILSTSSQIETMKLKAELSDLNDYLEFSRRKPLTWKGKLAFLAIVAALLVFQRVIGLLLAL